MAGGVIGISDLRKNTAIVRRAAYGNTHIPIKFPVRVLESWERSRDIYQIDRGKKLTVRVLTRTEWRERQERLEHFFAVADIYIASLHERLRDLNFCVLVTDSSGATIDLRNGTINNGDLTHIDLVRGACWPEDAVGTGGIGTALYERAPILVHRQEHFHPQLFEMSCSAAPINDVDGNVLAILNTTGLHITSDRPSQMLIHGLVVQTAAMIENAWFLAQNQGRWVIELSRDCSFFTTAADQMIAFDESGAVFCGNRASRDDLLDGTQVQGSHLNRLFDTRTSDLIHAAREQPGCIQQVYSCRNGVRHEFYARLRGPCIRHLATSHLALHRPVEDRCDADDMGATICPDPRMTANIAMVQRLIDRHLPILVLGETGTGKEMFAQAMHRYSERRDKPFVVVNCAAIPETLIESELFGYGPGAFTGAKAKGERGKILQADGGTLFLDEIGDMPLPLQTSLLRVLAEGEIAPLGSPNIHKVDLNVICATHRDLLAMVQQGQFRDDLYYRINTATVRLPPLRERSDLQQLLLKIFTEEAAAAGRESLRLSPKFCAFASAYSWPGNIRQLRNTLRFAVAVCDGTEIDLTHLPACVTQRQVAPMRSTTSVAESVPKLTANVGTSCERDCMIAELRSHHWRVSRAAKAMGISRATLYRRMKRHAIVSPNQAGSDPSNTA